MSKRNHTPGPWVVANGLQVWAGGPDALSSPRICTLQNGHEVVRQIPHDEMAVNARLIAAAPDLIDALLLLTIFGRSKISDRAAREAIAKALGTPLLPTPREFSKPGADTFPRAGASDAYRTLYAVGRWIDSFATANHCIPQVIEVLGVIEEVLKKADPSPPPPPDAA